MTDEEARPRGAEVAAEMAASGALDDIFARIERAIWSSPAMAASSPL